MLKNKFILLLFIWIPISFALGKDYEINYTEGYIKAYGYACSQNNTDRALAEIQALEAARSVALMHLAEAIGEVKLVGNVKVKDMQFYNSWIERSVNTILRGALQCPDENYQFIYDPNAKRGCVKNYCVYTQILYSKNGVRFLIPIVKSLKKQGYPSQPPTTENLTPSTAASTEKVVTYNPTENLKDVDGLIIDASELYEFEPSMMVIIETQSLGGEYKPIFAPTMVDIKAIRKKGSVVAYVQEGDTQRMKWLMEAWNIKHPLRVKAIDVTPEGALVVSRKDAIKIVTANQKNHFLEKGNVIIILPK
jgi:hypothetical protein